MTLIKLRIGARYVTDIIEIADDCKSFVRVRISDKEVQSIHVYPIQLSRRVISSMIIKSYWTMYR